MENYRDGPKIPLRETTLEAKRAIVQKVIRMVFTTQSPTLLRLAVEHAVRQAVETKDEEIIKMVRYVADEGPSEGPNNARAMVCNAMEEILR